MTLRERERASIRSFLEEHAGVFGGHAKVLDLGCGNQPYRELIENAGGNYCGHDRIDYPANVPTADPDLSMLVQPPAYYAWDVIVCTQVIQYVPDPTTFVARMRRMLDGEGTVLMTGPTNWPIVEHEDLWRMTAEGASIMLTDYFRHVTVGYRDCEMLAEGEKLPTGWWAVAIP